MTRTFSGDGIYIAQRDFQQILLRGKGDGRFAETVNGEISLLPPKDNLRMISNENFLFAKQSFDQWSLIYLEEVDYNNILKFISSINTNDEILASDYSYGQIYFEILDNELQKNEMPQEIYEYAKKNFLERYEKINWNEYHESLPFNTSALSLYEWSPIAEELKSLDKKIVLNSMILKWDNVKKEFIELINF